MSLVKGVPYIRSALYKKGERLSMKMLIVFWVKALLGKQLQIYKIYTHNTTNDLHKTIALLDTFVRTRNPLIN